jgi:hypothetical protein
MYAIIMAMNDTAQKKSDLKKKFEKVQNTPPSFELFVAIHDFIEHIESDAALVKALKGRVKANKELDVATKFGYLKQIHQGLEDLEIKTTADLGHARYSVVRELSHIKQNDVSESNSFWKRREFSKRLAGVIYGRLDAYLSETERPKKATTAENAG